MEYSREAWVERAKKLASKVPEKFDVLLAEDMYYIDALDKVIRWCDSKRLIVNFQWRAADSYCPDSKVITINKGSTPRIQLQVLLHECGHYLIGRPKSRDRYSMGYIALKGSNPKLQRSLSHRIDVLDEEYEAWERGWKLGMRLGALHKMDRPSYNQIKVRMIKGYIKWVTESWE